MTSTDFSNLIRKLSALDNQACQEVAVTAVTSRCDGSISSKTADI